MSGNVIISGAAGNLGKSVVQKLSDAGFDLHVTVETNHSDAFKDKPEIDAQAVDLLNTDAAHSFIESTIEKAGNVTAGIFLVGGYAPGGIADTDDADIEKMIHLNFMTAFHLVKPLKAHFEAQGGGQFIFIGARPALEPKQGAGNFAYALSKSLIFEMAEMINAEGESKNITATVIVPSTIDTVPNRKAMPDSDFNKWISADDIAEAIAFTLSESGKKMRQTVIKMYNQA